MSALVLPTMANNLFCSFIYFKASNLPTLQQITSRPRPVLTDGDAHKSDPCLCANPFEIPTRGNHELNTVKSRIGMKPGRVPEWTKGADCKSAIRGFESHRGLFRNEGEKCFLKHKVCSTQ